MKNQFRQNFIDLIIKYKSPSQKSIERWKSLPLSILKHEAFMAKKMHILYKDDEGDVLTGRNNIQDKY